MTPMLLNFLFKLSIFVLIFCLFSFGNLITYAQEVIESPIRMCVTRFSRPEPKFELVERTKKELEKTLNRKIELIEANIPELDELVADKVADIIIAGSGFYRRSLQKNIHGVATMKSGTGIDPRHALGSVIVVRDDSKIHNLHELEGTTLGITHEKAFQGFLIPLLEILKLNKDPENFFKGIKFINESSYRQLQRLRNKEVDVIFLPSCFLENLEREEPDASKGLRVINQKITPLKCKVTTQLYPDYGLRVTTDNLTSNDIKKIYQTIYNMDDKNDLGWTVPVDYSEVENLYKTLEKGIYTPSSLSLKKIWKDYKQYAVFILVLLTLWAVMTVRASRLVKKRTQELSEVHRKQMSLISRELELQKKYEKSQKALIVSQLSSIVAHELSQPVGSILLYAQSLERLAKREGGDSKEMNIRMLTAASEISASASKVQKIIQAVRSYAKSEPNQSFNLAGCLEEVVSQFRKSKGLNQGELSFNCFSNKIPFTGSSVEIQVLLTNLLKNAFEAASALPVFLIAVSVQELDNRILITVSNNGKIIDDAEMERLKTLFNSSKKDGLGLGLSLVRAIEEKHDGSLHFTNPDTGGLTVTVSLPTE